MTESQLHPVVRQAKVFTETYKEYIDAPPAVREAACLKTQYPALVGPIKPDDVFAGSQAEDRITYLGVIWWARMPGRPGSGKQGGYCFDFAALDRYGDNPADRAVLEELTEFWRHENTCAKIFAKYSEDDETFTGLANPIIGGGCGMCLVPDLDRLVRRGIPGLYQDVDRRIARGGEGADLDFLRSLRTVLDVLSDVCRHYAAEAREKAEQTTDEKDKDRLLTIARSLEANLDHAPQSLHEAMQLVWITSIITSGQHIDAFRPDVALGDLYVRDIEAGVLTEDEALDLVLALWKKFTNEGNVAVCRVLVGGKGRRNEANADRFALAAIKASSIHQELIPQLTLRFYEGQDPALMEAAYDALATGCVYPLLYNDDAILPGVEEALRVSPEDALNYHPLGCGEYMIAGRSPSELNFVISIGKALDAALRNGVDRDGVQFAIQTGDAREFESFEELLAAFYAQIDWAVRIPARIHVLNNSVLREECSLLLGSLLTDDCLERGRAMMDGGVRYNGACIMGHGFTNAADSLIAIKQLVFEQQAFTMGEIIQALDDDFEGHELLHSRLKACPKFGNDIDEVDDLYGQLWDYANRAVAEAGEEAGLDFLTISSVNPGGYFTGENCGATPDGRRAGQPFAIGHAPTAGNDTRGITALLNSVAKLDPANGGAVTNLKLNPDFFAHSREKVEAVMATFFEQGGLQAMISSVSQQDLEAAMEEPDSYGHLLVRVGGFTCRFVELDRNRQLDILKRTEY
ncbi:MAG: pyruvate formate lyase family protein [Candidatus Brocadiia bacterium]